MHDRLHSDVAREPSRVRPQIKPEPELGIPFFVFGIALPFFTLMFELVTHMCAMDFFNPIPTWWHVFLVGVVPVTNFLIWRGMRQASWQPGSWLSFFSGVSLGVSGMYMIPFLPMAPFAMMGVVFLGFGLLPLSPMIAFGNAMRARAKLALRVPRRREWAGMFAGVLALAAPFGWNVGTAKLIDWASMGSPEQRVSAVRWIRWVGNEQYLLERCYGSRARMGDFTIDASMGNMERIEQAREVYYRVTGHAFNTQPAPAGVSLTGRGRGSFNIDEHLGGTRVASKVPGLTLESSQFESKIDTIGLTSYTEWTAVFKNIAANASEARAQLELPPGGVVSRVTLWIDGQPREAAFGGRDQVRAAYQSIAVVQRRDPILVTTCGPDRVLMQCFPVPAAGEMKIRLGVTAPLRLTETKSVGVSLPRVVENNYEAGRYLNHRVVVKSDAAFADGKQELHREYSDAGLSTAPEIRVTLPNAPADSQTDDPTDAQYVIRQLVRSEQVERPKRVVYVIDGSRSVAPYRRSLSAIFEQANEKPDAAIFAGDVLEKWDGTVPFATWLRQRSFGGGCDNVPGLRAALESVANEAGSAIVWIHGPQPAELQNVDSLLNRVESLAHRPVIYDIAVEPGPNRIVEKMDGSLEWKRMTGYASPLREVMEVQWNFTGTRVVRTTRRERVPRSELLLELPKVDGHIARLWGREQVDRLRKDSKAAAMELAVKLQLVTPVSGAVVLETKEQYDRHGLQPVDPGTVPMIPEPGSVVLLASAVGCLAMRRRRVQRC